MTKDNNGIGKPLFFTIGIIVLFILQVWILIVLYQVKSEQGIIRTNSWNAYDSADACYQAVRSAKSNTEQIIYSM